MNWYAVATLRKYKIRLYCLPQSPDNPLVMKHGIILFRFQYTFYFILVLWYYNCLSDSNGFFYETCPECRGNHIIFNVQQSSSLQVLTFTQLFVILVITLTLLSLLSFASAFHPLHQMNFRWILLRHSWLRCGKLQEVSKWILRSIQQYTWKINSGLQSVSLR